MQDINLSVQGIDVDYLTARAMATSVAQLVEKQPVIISWYDKPQGRIGPDIPGADLQTRWRDYGESNGGNLEISVNGDYEFVFGDSEAFTTVEESTDPYVNVRDSRGNEYLCFRGVKLEADEICEPLDDTTAGVVGH